MIAELKWWHGLACYADRHHTNLSYRALARYMFLSGKWKKDWRKSRDNVVRIRTEREFAARVVRYFMRKEIGTISNYNLAIAELKKWLSAAKFASKYYSEESRRSFDASALAGTLGRDHTWSDHKSMVKRANAEKKLLAKVIKHLEGG